MKERPVSSLWFPAVVFLGVAVAVWFIFDSPLIRGIILGSVGSVALLVGGTGLMIRRVKKKMTAAQGGLAEVPLPDRPWEIDLVGTSLGGETVDLSDPGGRVLVLNYWATWCGPCVAEMPSLMKLMERTAESSVDYAFVTSEPEEKVRPFLEKRGWDLPVVIVDQEALKPLQARGIPATFVIGGDGRIALRHIGAAQWDSDEVVNFIRGLAATPS